MRQRIADWLARRSLRELKRDREAKMNIKEFLVFAAIVFTGFLAGGFVVDVIGISGTDALAQAVAFIIPTFLVYGLWKWLGASWAKKL